MNRKQRRALESPRSKGKGRELVEALVKAEKAVASVDSSKLDQLPMVIQSLKDQTVRAARLADAMADDYEALLIEVEVNREFLRQLLPSLEAEERDVRSLVLEKRKQAKENPDPEKRS